MSRSYRHTPVTGITTARSEKDDKRQAHRNLRAATRAALETVMAQGEAVFPVMREVSDVYSFAKDTKKRFDPKANPKLKRK
jgi:predicted GNAT superfamily acetyltransferase